VVFSNGAGLTLLDAVLDVTPELPRFLPLLLENYWIFQYVLIPFVFKASGAL
jgi:hypothetical protein